MLKVKNTPNGSPSKDYVFTSDPSGELIFKGNFEDYYKNEDDPWDQSAQGESAKYYQLSRNRIATLLQQQSATNVLEIGCGLGYACQHFNSQHQANYTGWDISNEAITKAQHKFPAFGFAVFDIASAKLEHTPKYDVVVLNQLLWYILPELDQVIQNCKELLTENGRLIIANAFAREQKFGLEYIDGFGGAFNYFNAAKHPVQLLHCEYNDDDSRNLDGLFVFKPK